MDAVTLRRRVLVAFSALIVLALSACSVVKGLTVDPLEELKSRPSYEVRAAEILAMLDELKPAISELAPNLFWRTEWSYQDGLAGCVEPFNRLNDADTGTFSSGNADGAIPADVWPQVKMVVIQIAAKYGFTDARSLKDDPGGDRMLVIRDRYEGSVELGTLVNTTLGVFGDCGLRSQPRPSPSPTPSPRPSPTS